MDFSTASIRKMSANWQIKYITVISENFRTNKSLGLMIKQTHEKGYRGRPLNEAQKAENKRKSQTRSRIEDVFGYMTGTMRGITVRSIGITLAAFNIGLTNLVCNLCRYEILCRKQPVTG